RPHGRSAHQRRARSPRDVSVRLPRPCAAPARACHAHIMRHALVTILAISIPLGCGGGGSDPVEIRVDTFNVGLAGAFVPNEATRREPVIAAVAAMESDIVCLQEVWEQSDKDRIRDAALAQFPHIVSFTN